MSTILPWFTTGGPFVIPLVVVGLIGFAHLIERAWYLSARSRLHAAPFMETVIGLARAGETDEALRLCADHRAALADLGLVVLRSASRDPATLRETATVAAAAILPPQRRGARWLWALTLLVLMLGALGAIANLHLALSGVALEARGGGLVTAAFALRPLGVALLLALPLVTGAAFVSAESERLASQLEDFASRLVSALTDGPDVRLGHRT